LKLITRIAPLFLVLTAACNDVVTDDPTPNEEEVITTVVLTFSPDAGGADLAFRWADPEDDGSPVIDDVVLPNGAYTLSVGFLNELEEPAEEITEEIEDESDEHQIFVTGSGIEGPATGTNAAAVLTHAYADTDANGLPIGLDNTITGIAAGTGELTISLRHLPAEDGTAVKVADLAADVATGGFGSIAGDNDVQVTFPLEVQ
jgi:hypothetical protein